MVDLESLARDSVIVSMAQDLIDADFPPAPTDAHDYSDYVFAAAMEFSFRGGDIESVGDFSDPAEAVRLAYLDLGGRSRS